MMRTTRLLLTFGAVLAPLGAPVAASAQDGRFQVTAHVEYSGNRTGDFRVGEPLMIQVRDTQGTVTEREYCWTPAPIDRPACSSNNQGAPAQVGTQKVEVTMSDGTKLTHTFAVQPAASVVKPMAQASSPVPFVLTCASQLYGQRLAGGRYAMPLGTVAAGTQVAAYYSPQRGWYQVVTLNTFQAGFMSTACLKSVASGATKTQVTFTLRSNATKTYRLRIPKGFTVTNVAGQGTGVSYEIDVKGGGFGNGVANPIFAKGGGVHLPFLGATVVRDGYDKGSNSWFVRVRTRKLAKPLTLQILAYGTRSTS